MKKLSFLFAFVFVIVLCANAVTVVHHIPDDLKLRSIPIPWVFDDPTPEEQARLKQYFDSAYAVNPHADAMQVCYDYNKDVAPYHKGTYWIVFNDDNGNQKSKKCDAPSKIDSIPILSQLWAALKWFIFFVLALAVPVIAKWRKWPKALRILIYIIFAVPVFITGLGFVVAALASIWAIICGIIMVVGSLLAIGAAVGTAGSAFARHDVESHVDNYARTHGGMYEHGSREASIQHEMDKRTKKK